MLHHVDGLSRALGLSLCVALGACSSGSGDASEEPLDGAPSREDATPAGGDSAGGGGGDAAALGDDAAQPGSDATPPVHDATTDDADGALLGEDASVLDANGAPEEGAPGEGGAPDAGTDAIYAAPNGAGTSCTLAAPCSLAQAFATVRAAAPGMSADIAVYLRGGTYRLASALALGIADSGQNGHQVHYRAYAGESPVLSGAVQVTGFTQYDAP